MCTSCLVTFWHFNDKTLNYIINDFLATLPHGMPANVPQSVVRHPVAVPTNNVSGNTGQQQFFGPANEQINTETQITNLGKFKTVDSLEPKFTP